MKFGLLIDIDVDNIFRKYLALLGGLGSKMRPFFNLPKSHNQKTTLMRFRFFTPLKVWTDVIRNIK